MTVASQLAVSYVINVWYASLALTLQLVITFRQNNMFLNISFKDDRLSVLRSDTPTGGRQR